MEETNENEQVASDISGAGDKRVTEHPSYYSYNPFGHYHSDCPFEGHYYGSGDYGYNYPHQGYQEMDHYHQQDATPYNYPTYQQTGHYHWYEADPAFSDAMQ